MLPLLNTIEVFSPGIKVSCYAAAGYFMGRKFCLAAGCKLGSLATEVLGKDSTEWERLSAKYLTLAKKDAVRDLKMAAGFIAAGYFIGYLGDTIRDERIKAHCAQMAQLVQELKDTMEFEKTVLCISVMGIYLLVNGLIFSNCCGRL